jgi:probable phosphoglycerate mutase
MIFYYVRHGDPIYEPDSLTELGHKQAEALSKRFALTGLDEIYASTSMRARMTAEPTCKLLGKEMTLLDWANEGHAFFDFSVDIGGGERRWAFHRDDYKKKFWSEEVRALGMDWYKHPAFANENFARGVERIERETDAFLKSLGFEHDRKNACYRSLIEPNGGEERRVALFAHEGFGKAFLSSVMDLPYPYVATRYELTHSSVTVLQFDDQSAAAPPKILQWSNDSHLYKEGILTPYNHWKLI